MMKFLFIIISLIQLLRCSSGDEVRIVTANLDTDPNTYLLESWKKGCPKETNVSRGPTDGRFTLGVGNKRLMYGYPSPSSTSYFVLRVGNKLASNTSKFCEASYLTGTEEMDNYSGIGIVRYRFLDIEIEQFLIPTNEKLEHVTSEIRTKYYRVEYNIINKSRSNQKVSLAILIDTMIDDNDGPRVAIYKETRTNFTQIESENSFSGKEVPKGILLFQTGNDMTKLTGEVVLKEEGNVPDEVLIGSWPYFIGKAWGIFARTEARYSDSALLLRWNNQNLKTNEAKVFYFFYGIAQNTKESLDVIYNDDKIEEKKSQVFYDANSIQLNPGQKKSIDESFEAVKGSEITGVTIEGFSDAKGDEKTNELVSKERAIAVKNYISSNHKISKDIIIIKPMSSSLARRLEVDLIDGNKEDRKAVIKIATREKKDKNSNEVTVTKKNFKSIAEKSPTCTFLYRNGQVKVGKLIEMKNSSILAMIDNRKTEISKKELKTIQLPKK